LPDNSLPTFPFMWLFIIHSYNPVRLTYFKKVTHDPEEKDALKSMWHSN
jgi:hypothetical protein